MPGWHEATRELEAAGKLQVLGIVQEQHPHRARLFMQWKGMDWPILVDAYNLLATSAVPITLLIDEHGIVRHSLSSVSRSRGQLEAFLEASYDPPSGQAASTPAVPPLESLRRRADREDDASAWRDHADALALWGGEQDLEAATESYTTALAFDPDDGPTEFRLGVTFRRLYDTPRGTAAEFGRAVEHWERALELEPNNYIWRRRIQQYGPRLDKPYPFYDWVDEARVEIEARGEKPVELPVEPRGAELAHPSREFETTPAPPEPDPEGRILRDAGRYVSLDTTVVPHAVRREGATRVHVELRPVASADAHWNNEASGLLVWLDPPAGWEADRRRAEVGLPATGVSDEPRRVEFELRLTGEEAASTEIPGYALYYVCEGRRGACLYRRQDFRVPVGVAGEAGGG